MLNYIDHGRDLGLLRAPLPGGLLGAARPRPGRRDRRHRPARRASRRSTSRAPRSRRGSTWCSRSPTWRPRSCWSGSASCWSSARRCWSTTSTSASRRPGATSRSGSRSGWSPTPGSRRSRTWPRRRRTPTRTIPRGVGARGARGGRALRVLIRRSRSRRCRSPRTPRATSRPSSGTTFADDPVLGIVENLGLGSGLTDALRVYVGVLAAVILLIATNAGLIGVSRLTYSMGQHRQLPGVPAPGPPALPARPTSRSSSSPRSPRSRCSRARPTFLATMYSFGAMLSFTVAHVSVIRAAPATTRSEASGPGGRRSTSASAASRCPMTAVLGGLGTFGAWIVVMALDPRHAGRRRRLDGRSGSLVYVVYRRYQGLPLTRDGQGGDARAARGRGGRVPERPGRLRRGRAVLRGGGRDRGQARLASAGAGDPRAGAGRRAGQPAARRRAARAGERGPEQDRAGEADRRAAGHRQRRRGCARARRARRSSRRRRRSRRRRS